MGLGTGVGAFMGIAPETVYGTFVAPTTFLEMNSESISVNADPRESFPLTGGRFLPSGNYRQNIKGAGGDTEHKVLTKGLGKLFRAALGTVVTSQPDAVNQPLHYRHVFTPHANGLRGIAYSVQLNRPSVDGNDRAFSYRGGKVASWELAAALNADLLFTATWDFAGESTAEALGTPNYAAGAKPFIDLDIAVQIDGAASCVKGVSIKGDNALGTDDRWCLGGTKNEPLTTGESTITGSISKEFENLTLYNKFINGAHAALILTASLGEIDAGKSDPFQVIVTIPDLVFTGETPNVGGPDIVEQSLPFKALNNGTDPVITIQYETSDATP